MIRSFVINNYLGREYLKVIFNMTLAFFALGFIINVFEEVNLFKDYEVGLGVPVLLSALFEQNIYFLVFC